MDATLTVTSTDLREGGEATASLLTWLSRDSEVRRHCRPVPVHAPPEPGAMGSALEAISLVIGNVTALGGLTVAVAVWLQGRSDRTVRISRGDTTVVIDRASPGQVSEIARALRIPDPAVVPDAAVPAATLPEPGHTGDPAPAPDGST
ncbi:hypothetical protein ACIQUQ_04595 [Streptomyces sp. NPDC101118]|uniref:effector-associated constant component EACC1 n=1 Tax=Streptomyces sp. NPDC101118 TaxID=3366109 RepID=UPI003828F616